METNDSIKEPKYYFLEGGGEMGELTRAFDWSKTAIGSPEIWPASLRTMVSTVLASRFPMLLMWGTELTQFYNDAFRPSLGINGKHPYALGENAVDTWAEIWEVIHPLLSKVLTTGEAIWSEDQFIPIYRNGKMEDVYWTFGYSAVRNETGVIQGVLVVCTETTEKVLTVKRLEESEKRFQNLIKQAPVGIIVLRGPDVEVDIANEAYCKLAGYRSDELVGKKLFEVLPEAEAKFRPIIDEARTSGQPIYLNKQHYITQAPAQPIEGYIDLIYQPYRDHTGEIVGVMVLCHDVTDEVIAGKQASDAQQQLRAIVASAPFPIGVYMGIEMRIVVANQSIIDVWGKGDDIIGKLYSEILPELGNQHIFEQLNGVYTTGVPFHARNQRIDIMTDGKMKPYYFNYSLTPLYDDNGRVYGVMNTAADVTDLNVAKLGLEQSEKNFRNMILQAPVAMCILLGPEYVVEVANAQMIQLWGKPEHTVMNKPIFEALPDAREQGLEQLMNDVYRTGESFIASERPVDLIRNGKPERTYQNFVYQPYRDSKGAILGIIAISTEVTVQVLARQKIEEIVADRTMELEIANVNLQKSNAELEQFAYIASHDLQEPLRKVSTYSEMLERNLGDVDERSRGYMNKIKGSTSRMASLIRGVLSYSQIARNDERFELVDLQQTVEQIKSDLEIALEQKQANLIIETLPKIQAIPLQMSQLFANLISNALKFSKTGVPPVLTISAEKLSPAEASSHLNLEVNKPYYLLQVRDNGIGFKQEHAGQIFNIFQRLHGKTEYSGTGIGLAMCKKIADNHGGTIYATSSTGNGATFTVILPIEQP
jgi:PAS domain S-box-containing protein